MINPNVAVISEAKFNIGSGKRPANNTPAKPMINTEYDGNE